MVHTIILLLHRCKSMVKLSLIYMLQVPLQRGYDKWFSQSNLNVSLSCDYNGAWSSAAKQSTSLIKKMVSTEQYCCHMSIVNISSTVNARVHNVKGQVPRNMFGQDCFICLGVSNLLLWSIVQHRVVPEYMIWWHHMRLFATDRLSNIRFS